MKNTKFVTLVCNHLGEEYRMYQSNPSWVDCKDGNLVYKFDTNNVMKLLFPYVPDDIIKDIITLNSSYDTKCQSERFDDYIYEIDMFLYCKDDINKFISDYNEEDILLPVHTSIDEFTITIIHVPYEDMNGNPLPIM